MSKMKRIVSLGLVFILLVASFNLEAQAESDETSTDISGHWAEEEIKQLMSMGIVDGTDQGDGVEVLPDKEITRAEFIALIIRSKYSDEELQSQIAKLKIESEFTDTSTHWAKDYIAMGQYLGLIKGYEDGTFLPDQTISRPEVVTVIMRMYSDDTENDEENTEDESNNGDHEDIKEFADLSPSFWAYDAIQAAVRLGFVTGYPDDTFGIESNISRAEAMVVLTRTIDAEEKNEEPEIVASTEEKKHSSSSNRSSTSTTKYDISFNMNYDDPTDTVPSQSVVSGSYVNEPVDPERSGYVFIGWFTDSVLSGLYSFESRVTSARTLYAGWEHVEEESLVEAYEMLEIGYAAGDNKHSVTSDVTLPTTVDVTTDASITIIWSSDTPDTITDSGQVTRTEGSNVDVTLTAQISTSWASVEKNFDLTVARILTEDDLSVIVDHTEVDTLASLNDGVVPDTYTGSDGEVLNIDGQFSELQVESSNDAVYALESVRTLFGIEEPKDEFEPAVANYSVYGSTYVLQQTYKGVSVYGRNATVSSDTDSYTDNLNINYLSGIAVTTEPAISLEAALSEVTDIYGSDLILTSEGLTIWSLNEYETDPTLAYIISVETSEDAETFDSFEVFVNAMDGTIVDSVSNVMADHDTAGTGIDEAGAKRTFPLRFKTLDFYFYYMEDSARDIHMYSGSKTPGNRVGSEFKSIWMNSSAVSAYTNVITTFDWYKDNLGRNSIDGEGMAVDVIVNRNGGKENAYWSSSDSSINFHANRLFSDKPQSTAGSLDIMAHEYTHGVVQYVTGGIPYENYTGALNEAYADIIGCLVDGDWVIGEDWLGDSNGIRNISDPSQTGDPEEFEGTNWVSITTTPSKDNDQGGVHSNCTVLSYAAYLMSENGIDDDTLANLWYESLKLGYNADSTFMTVRLNVLKASEKMMLDDEEIDTIIAAFDDVNVKLSYELSGKITIADEDTDSTNNEPLENAVIRIAKDNYSYSTTTDSNGLYSIKFCEPGTYQVHVSKDGYISGTQTIEFLTNIEETFNMTIEAISEDYIGEGYAAGKIKDSFTGSGVSDITLNIREGIGTESGIIIQTLTTDSSGNYETKELSAGNYCIEAVDNRNLDDESDRYYTTYFDIKILGNTSIEDQNSVISRDVEDDQLRIVLTWGEQPEDLDSHIIGPTGMEDEQFHVFFNKDNYEDRVNLDVDDVSSYGPETITVLELSNGVYTYYVHDYTNSNETEETIALSSSGAKVQLFIGSILYATYYPPSDAEGTKWEVFSYDSESSTVTAINRLSYDDVFWDDDFPEDDDEDDWN